MDPRPQDELWKQWRAAEVALAQDPDGSGLDAAVTLLPERLRWYFRAMAATLAGDAKALGELAPAAPNTAARALAEVGHEERDARRPTPFRAKLKAAGVPNAPYPVLDLMRLYIAAKNSENRPRMKSIVAKAAERPVLDATLTTLSRTFRDVDRREALEGRSMHAAIAWYAEVQRQEITENVAQALEREFYGTGPEIHQWRSKDWSDLDVLAYTLTPLGRRQRGRRMSSQDRLDAFLLSPVTSAWTEDLIHGVIDLRSSLSQPALENLGGRLLEATYLALHAGRLDSARGAVMGALLLLRDSLVLPAWLGLSRQLARLFSTMNFLLRESDTDSVCHLWTLSAGLALDVRISIASQLSETIGSDVESNGQLDSLLAHALLGSGTAQRKKILLADLGGVLSFAQCESALKDTGKQWLASGGDPAALALWRGWMFAALGPPAGALQVAQELLDLGDSRDFAEPLVVCLTESLRQRDAGRQYQRQLQRTLGALGKRLGTSDAPDLSLVYFSYLAATNAPRKAGSAGIMKTLAEIGRKASSNEDGGGGSEVHERLRLAMILGDGAWAVDAFRALGRWLPKAAREESLPAALTIAAECVMYEVPESGWFCDDIAASVRSQLLPVDEWCAALTTFLNRHPAETVGKVAVSLHFEGTVTGEALLTWYERDSELDRSFSWDLLEQRVGPYGEFDDLAALAEEMTSQDAAAIMDMMMGGKRRR